MFSKDKSFLHSARPAKKRPPNALLGALDIETVKVPGQADLTTALGGECVILTYCHESTIRGESVTGKRKHRKQKRIIEEGHVRSWADFFKILEIRPELSKITWFAHNMEFDFARAHDEVIKLIEDGYVMKPIINGLGRFICLKLYRPDGELFFSLRDSAAVLLGTLDDITRNLAPEFAKLTGTIDWANEEFDISNALHVEYAIRDSRGLLESMINLETLLIDNFGCVLKLTAASISMQSFRVTLGKDGEFYKRPDKTMRDYIRQAYYGGFVFCGYETGKTQVGKLYHVDFSSCYPFCMRAFGVPDGHIAKTVDYKQGDIGIFQIKVSIKDTDLPLIPLRTKNGIVWPRGEFETIVSSIEIENLIKYNVQFEVIEGIKFQKMCYPFKKIVDKCEAMRKQHKGTVLEMLAKLIQNSLYGKFASKEELQETIYSKDHNEDYDGLSLDDFELTDNETGLNRYKQTKDKELDEDYLIVSWSVFITAHARRHLHEHMTIAGLDNVFYTDTDSLVVNQLGYDKLTEAGKIKPKDEVEYGDLALECEYQQFIAIAPKVYASLTVDGKFKGKAKGLPKKLRDEELFEFMLSGQESDRVFNYESVTSLKGVLKGQDYSQVRTRTLSKFKNSNGWVYENDRVLTKHINEINKINPLQSIFE